MVNLSVLYFISMFVFVSVNKSAFSFVWSYLSLPVVYGIVVANKYVFRRFKFFLSVWAVDMENFTKTKVI